MLPNSETEFGLKGKLSLEEAIKTGMNSERYSPWENIDVKRNYIPTEERITLAGQTKYTRKNYHPVGAVSGIPEEDARKDGHPSLGAFWKAFKRNSRLLGTGC